MLRAHPWVVSAATDETLHVMTRRTATLSLAAVLLVVLLALALLRPVPFVTLSPGPTRNTLGSFEGHQIVQISGRKVYPTKGALDLTTVRVTKPTANVSLVELGLAARTDEEGRYQLGAMTAGSYTVRVEKGTTVKTVTVTVPPGVGTTYDVQL